MSVSASQMDKIRDCERKFWFDWNEPRGESGPEAQLGTAIHDVAEDYHVRGKAPDRATRAGAAFLPALPYLPQPKAGRAEGAFEVQISGIEYKGIVDLNCTLGDLPVQASYAFMCNSTFGPRGRPGPETPIVLDYKSKKDFRRIFKGPGDFLNDPQAILYALKRLIQTGSALVGLRWVYIKREGRPKAVVCDALLTREEVLEAFGRINHPLATRLVQIKLTKPDPLTLTPTPTTCTKYGKKYLCKHIGKCNLDPLDSLGAEMENSMGMLEELEAEFGDVDAPKDAPAPKAKETTTGKVNAPEGKAKPMKPADAAKAMEQQGPGPARTLSAISDSDLGAALRTLATFVRDLF